MANKKFSEFELKTTTSSISHIVGYSGAENVQITPANFVTTGGTGIFLPLAGGTMTGSLVVDSTATVNDILTAGLGLALTGGTVGSGKLVLASTNKVHLSGGSAGLVLQNSAATKTLTIDDTGTTNDGKFVVTVGATQIGLSVDPNSGVFVIGDTDELGDGVYATNTGTSSFDIFSGGSVKFSMNAGGDVSLLAGNISLIDNKKAIFGSPGNDLEIYHDGAHSYIQDTSGTGELRVDTNLFRLRSANGGETMIRAFEDGAVILSHNNVDRLTTTSTGVAVTNTGDAIVQVAGDGISNSGGQLKGFNNGFGFTVAPAGGGTYVEAMRLDGAGNLGIATSNPAFKLQVSGSVALDVMASNETEGAVRIGRYDANTTRYNDIKSFVSGTAASNYLKLSVHGGVENATVDVLTLLGSGNATFAGSVTLPDTVQFKGTTYSSSFLSFWNDTTLSASDDIIFAATGGVEKMRLTSTGLGIGTSSASQKLHVSGNMRLTGGFRDRLNSQGAANYVLTSTGSNGTQWVDASNSSIIGGPYLPTAGGTMTGVTQFNDHTQYGDQVQARFGASNDLVIEHNGGNSFINDVGTGNLLITSNGVSVQINKGLTENMAEFITDGAVKLYYDSVKKFETTSSGISVTGSINVDGDSGDTAEFRGATQSTVNFKAGSVNNYLVATTTGTLSFRPNGSTSTTMLANGNVGIGTSAPTAKIQISGTNANNKIVSYFDGNFVSGFKFSDLNGGIWYDAGADDLYLSAAQANSQMIFEVAGSERMRVDSSGFIYVNTGGAEPSASQVGVKITGTQGQAFWSSANTGTSGYNHFNFYNSNGAVGSIVTNGSATAFNTSSDYRLKEDLQDFKGLDMVSKIPVYDFKWKVDESRSYGVMAHELEEVLPQAVSGDKDAKEMQSVDYSKIVPLLVKSIQELKAEIELLKK